MVGIGQNHVRMGRDWEAGREEPELTQCRVVQSGRGATQRKEYQKLGHVAAVG